MINFSKNIFGNHRKFQICFPELGSRQTGFMWGNTFNTFPLFSKDPSNALLYPSYSPPGQRPLSGWLHIFSITRHNSRSHFQNNWMAGKFAFARQFKETILVKILMLVLEKEIVTCEI